MQADTTTVPGTRPGTRLGLPELFRRAFALGDFLAYADVLVAALKADPNDTGAAMDLATVLTLLNEQEQSDNIQHEALLLNRHYRLQSNPPNPTLRLLAIVTTGDLTDNTPLDFLLQGSGFALETLYVLPGEGMPEVIPEHDVAIVAVAYSSRNAATLDDIADAFARWPKPVINLPRRILTTSRHGIAQALTGIDGLLAPMATIHRAAQLAEPSTRARLPLPFIIRPQDSQGGNDLRRIDRHDQLDAYLAATSAEQFYVTPFCDYRSGDGLYRKFRVVLINGRPFLAHMALRDHWMIHYVNANMAQDAGKRAAEAHAMAEFDDDFAQRHAHAFAEIHARLGLDHLTIDCGEMPDGRLLIFEADTGMLVHDMDSPELYPYKRPQMRRLFDAYQDMLLDRYRAAQSRSGAGDHSAGDSVSIVRGASPTATAAPT